MHKKFSYRDYVSDEKFLDDYNAYQEKYADCIRESDKVIIEFVRNATLGWESEKTPRLLDIGCSTGNLLLHLKRLVPGLEMIGGDLAKSSLESCRCNPNLSGISFHEMDILDLAKTNAFDIIVANAVAVYFDWDEYECALRSVLRALRPGGAYIVFEWMHAFSHQDLVIYETSVGHPDGIRICFRPISKVKDRLQHVGFEQSEFHPFVMPIDLPRTGHDEEVVSYTVKDEQGSRMTFRGALFQPWCHMIARKPRGAE